MDSQMKIRFHDPKTKEWIAEQAKLNKRSLNAEINYHLEQVVFKQQQEKQRVTAN